MSRGALTNLPKAHEMGVILHMHLIEKQHELALDRGLLSSILRVNNDKIGLFNHILQQQGQKSSEHKLHCCSAGSSLFTQLT